MRVRDNGLQDDLGFEEPTDWAIAPGVDADQHVQGEAPQSFGIRALRDDRDDHWREGPSQ